MQDEPIPVDVHEDPMTSVPPGRSDERAPLLWRVLLFLGAAALGWMVGLSAGGGGAAVVGAFIGLGLATMGVLGWFSGCST